MQGISYKLVPAVDGRTLSPSSLSERGVSMLPAFSEPYHGRPLTYGEIGCFLSHHDGVWKDVVENGHGTVVVFEDDVRFEPGFRWGNFDTFENIKSYSEKIFNI